MTAGRLVPLAAGAAILGYGLWALYSGKVISTWAQTAHRPNPFYWIVTISLLLIGALNLFVALRPRGK